MQLILTVDGKKIPVNWEDNPSVNAIKTLARDTLTIVTMTMAPIDHQSVTDQTDRYGIYILGDGVRLFGQIYDTSILVK